MATRTGQGESLNVGEARRVGGTEWTEEFTVMTADPIPLSQRKRGKCEGLKWQEDAISVEV